jgi:hypothetical protein
MDELEEQGAKGEIVRAADHNIKPGVTSNEGAGDAWPKLRRAMHRSPSNFQGEKKTRRLLTFLTTGWQPLAHKEVIKDRRKFIASANVGGK